MKIRIDIDTQAGRDQLRALLDVMDAQERAYQDGYLREACSLYPDWLARHVAETSASPVATEENWEPLIARVLAGEANAAVAADAGVNPRRLSGKVMTRKRWGHPKARKEYVRRGTFIEPDDWEPLVLRVLAGEREKDVADEIGADVKRLRGKVMRRKFHSQPKALLQAAE
jgi:hypothetical protein